MTCRDTIWLAVSALRGNLIRTLLTILGFSVGVGAVLTVLTLGNSGEIRVEEEIAKLGVNKIWIRAASNRRELQASDARLISDSTGAAACAGAYGMSTIVMDSISLLTQIAGFDTSMMPVHSPKLLQGRTFLSEEFEKGKKVCLIDEVLAAQLGEDVVGKRLTLGGRRFCVIGVIKRMTVQSMAGGNGLCILPLNTFLDTMGGSVSDITLCVQNGHEAGNLAAQTIALLPDGHELRADTLEKEIGAAREVVRIFVLVLICVAAVCMLTGSIGVMNVLLVSVRERRREIGLMKAIGADSHQIGILFLLEAATYALLGGLIGILLGAGMISVFGRWIGLDARMQLSHALPVLIAAGILGVGFGVFPALKASALPPVDALKCE